MLLFLVASLPRCLVASLPRCLVASLPSCLVASLPRCLVATLPHCLVASLPRCLVASLALWPFGPLALGPLPLALGPWPLALGLGPWALGLGPWALGLGPWALGLGRWPLAFGLRPSAFGLWPFLLFSFSPFLLSFLPLFSCFHFYPIHPCLSFCFPFCPFVSPVVHVLLPVFFISLPLCHSCISRIPSSTQVHNFWHSIFAFLAFSKCQRLSRRGRTFFRIRTLGRCPTEITQIVECATESCLQYSHWNGFLAGPGLSCRSSPRPTPSSDSTTPMLSPPTPGPTPTGIDPMPHSPAYSKHQHLCSHHTQLKHSPYS